MMSFPRAIRFALAILACGFALRADAQSDSPTDAELRAAIREILASDEFRHFDHLPLSPGTASEPAAEPSATDPASEERAPANPPWWQRLRQRSPMRNETEKSSSGSSGADSARGSSSHEAATDPSERRSTETSQRPSSGDSSANSPSEAPRSSTDRATDGARDSGSSARPQRAEPARTSASRTSRPSQRGSDGVERPVRYAPRTARRPTESSTSSSPSSSNWGGGLFSGIGTLVGQLLHLVAYAVLAAVCVLIVALAVRAIAESWQHRRRRENGLGAAVAPLAHDRSPGETDADIFLQFAMRYAQCGDYRAALGQLLLGAMSWIERNEWIRYRRGLTVRDYLRSVRSRSEQYAGLKVVVEAYEPVEFGRRPATQPLFESALAGYRAGFDQTASQ